MFHPKSDDDRAGVLSWPCALLIFQTRSRTGRRAFADSPRPGGPDRRDVRGIDGIRVNLPRPDRGAFAPPRPRVPRRYRSSRPEIAFAPTTRSVRGFARRLVVAAVVVPRKSEDAPKGGERASSSLNLDDVMRNVRASLRLDDRGVASSGMTWGHGVFLGDPVRWALRHDAGSFAEEAAGPDLSYVSTHCAGADEVWETDHTGYTQVVQLDDHEASLLAAWARTGWWAHPDAKHDVELELGGARLATPPTTTRAPRRTSAR